MQIINPATETVIKTLKEDTPESVENKYIKVRGGQPAWYRKPLKERIEILARFNELLEENAEELAQTLTAEVGKPISQARGEIRGARGRVRFFLQNSEKYLTDEVVHEETGLTEKIVYEPLGLIANISAWNYPYLVGVNVFVPALIAGCGVLYKPSEHATLTGLHIHDLLEKAGVPGNVFQIVIGGAEAGNALLNLPLDGYFFTGSYKTGKHIYEKVAPKMVPCQLELGGKDPMYVAADNANIAKVAEAAVEGCMYNAGQSCCAVERIYVHTDVYDSFLDAFMKELENWKIGDPTNDKTQIGPLTREEQITVLEEQVKDAVNKGAKLLAGGKRADRDGYYFEPTVVVDAHQSMKIMQEESFGPIIGIQKVASDIEAIALMQDTEYGLTSAVYCDDKEHAEQILSQMNSGSVYWNCCDRVSANLPWSGRKHSGIGVTLSHLGIRAFTHPKGYHLRG